MCVGVYVTGCVCGGCVTVCMTVGVYVTVCVCDWVCVCHAGAEH